MQYLLDIETLLLYLNSRRQSGELTTSLKRFPGLSFKGTGRVYITLVTGKVTACTLHDEEGGILATGEFVLRGLKKLGQLDWNWQAATQTGLTPPSLPTQTIQQQPLRAASPVYRRVIPIGMINRSALTRKQWQLLLLVDGVRTAQQIANLLMPSPSPTDMQEVLKTLYELQQRGVLTLVTA